MATVDEIAARYLLWCEDHREQTTTRFYRCRLKPLISAFGPREFDELTQIDLEEHFTVSGKGLSGSTRRSNIVAFLRLQSWALERKLIAAAVAEKLEKPRAGRRDRIPTREETIAIRRSGSMAFRAIYQALRRSGARPCELCTAQISDLKEDRTVIELEKHKTAHSTGKPRRIQVGKKLRRIIERAIGERTEGPIFLSPRGRPWTVGNLSSTFRHLRNKAGLSKDLVLYMTRHEFGTKATEQFGIHAASKFLGHTQITTTQRYAHENEERLRGLQDDVL